MKSFSLFQRLKWSLVVVGIQGLYFPASHFSNGGIAPALPFEPLPVYPIWVIPYCFAYLFWVFAIYWWLFRLETRSFLAVLAGALLTVSLGVSVFFAFPTYVKPPVVTGHDLFSQLLRFVQVAGGSYAALPSAHNYMTMLIVAFAGRFYPRYRWLWWGILLAIALSTLFTGQHYALDVVFGLMLGWIGYRFGLYWVNRIPYARQVSSAGRG